MRLNKIKILLATMLLLSSILIGCDSAGIVVNVDNQENLSNNVFGTDALIEIGNNLYYDSATRIVYLWNGQIYTEYSISPSPYYAPNGLPYRYNPETNTFEEIRIANTNVN